MSDLLDNYCNYVGWFIPDKHKFVDIQVEERNKFTHRKENRKKKHQPFDYEKLYLHAEGVRYLCYGIIWIMLGLEEDFVIRAIESVWPEYRQYAVSELYASHEQEE